MTALVLSSAKAACRSSRALLRRSGKVERAGLERVSGQLWRIAEGTKRLQAALDTRRLADEAGATMPIAAFDATAGGLIKRVISPRLAAGISVAEPDSRSSDPGRPRTLFADHRELTTLSGETQRRNASTVVAAARVPVPEEAVGPTPRSKMRISISRSLQDADKLDVGLLREVAMHAISAPMVCQGLPSTANSGLSTRMAK